MQQLSVRFGQIYVQEPDLHCAVLINLTMATSVGDAAGVLVCLRRSQQVSVPISCSRLFISTIIAYVTNPS